MHKNSARCTMITRLNLICCAMLLTPIAEDDSIIDLTTRVRARHDATDEIDRRIMERLAHTPHAAHIAPDTSDSGLQARTLLCKFIQF